MRLTKRILAIAFMALALPGTAIATTKPPTIPQAQRAIERHEPYATITKCHRPYRVVVCNASEYINEGDWSGWTLEFTAYATPSRHGLIITTSI